jgi:cobalt-zinc-cadmium efflux system outer membrane protein
MGKYILSFLLMIGLVPLPHQAAEKGLSLEQAIAIALQNNPEILNAQKELDAARGRHWQLEALPNPEIVFSNEGMPLKESKGEKEISLGVQQLFEFPGKRALRGIIGKYGEDIAAFELERMKMLVSSEVTKAYWNAVYSQKVVSSLESILEILKQYTELANSRYQALQVSYLDVIRGRLEQLKLQNEWAEAKRQLKEDLIALNLAMGIQESEAPKLQSDLTFVPLEKSLEELEKDAASRPSLKVLNLQLDQAKANLKLSQKSHLPDFKIGLFYPSLRVSGWGIAVESSIPIFLKKQKGEMLEAEALREQNTIALEAKKKRITSLIDRLYSDLKVSEEQLRLFDQSLLAETENLLSQGISDYQYGKIDSLNLLDIYRTSKTTKLEYLKALLNFRMALAELEVAGERD